MVEVIISIGSNLGNRKNNINTALKKMAEKIHLDKISRIYRTEPREGVSGGWFLNGVVVGKTSLKPAGLLKFLQSIEQEMGRPVNHRKNSERTIDLDILFYGSKIIRRKNLIIPHPGIIKRDFVLKGLVQINPDFVHPETGKNITQIWQEFKNANHRRKRRNKTINQKDSH